MVVKKIQDHEDELGAAIEAKDFTTLDKALNSCHGVDIDVKLGKQAKDMHLRLEHELQIKTFLSANTHHDIFKTIRKDV